MSLTELVNVDFTKRGKVISIRGMRMNRTRNLFNLIKKPLTILVVALMLINIPIGVLTASANKSANWRDWKQYEGDWADKIYVTRTIGNGLSFGSKVGQSNARAGWGTVTDWGCYLLSMSIQIARSGAKTDFDPWDFIEHMHYGGYMDLDESGLDSLVGDSAGGVSTFTTNKFRAKFDVNQKDLDKVPESTIAEALKTVLDAGYYPIVKMTFNGGGNHFVAIDRVEGGTVYMFDPGSPSNNLFERYRDRATIDEIRVFESDVPSTKADGTPTGSSEITPADREKLNLNAFKWSEERIKGLPKTVDWEEEPVPIVHFLDLEPHQKDSISKWKEEIKQRNNADLVTINRVISMLLGMAMLLFSLVYLVSFVFDRITITEFRAMDALTRNRITVSGTGESTFFRGSGTYPKVINTRDLIITQVLMIGISVLILNGGVFVVISGIVNFIEYMKSLIGW